MTGEVEPIFTFFMTDSRSESKLGPIPKYQLAKVSSDRMYAGFMDFNAVLHGEPAAAADVVMRVINDMPQEIEAWEFNALANAALKDAFPNGPMPLVEGAILSHQRAEVWLYGQAFMAVVGEDLTKVEVIQQKAGFDKLLKLAWWRKDMIDMYCTEHGIELGLDGYEPFYKKDPGAKAIAESLHQFRQITNLPGGQAMLSTRMIQPDIMKIEKVVTGTQRIILGTGGYPAWVMDPEHFDTLDTMEEVLILRQALDPHCLGGLIGVQGIGVHPETKKPNMFAQDWTLMDIRVGEIPSSA